MHRITILTTHPGGGEFEPFSHGEMTFAFEPLTAAGPRKLIDGPGWAFIDWIIPELSGLEMCRRLRADNRTAGAHITMVLERDDLEDRRRAMRAGADDYMIGPVSRQSILDRINPRAVIEVSCPCRITRGGGMMILGNVRLSVLGALLAVLATPSLAAPPAERAGTNPKAATSAGSQSADASRSRRVELPFPLDLSSPDREPRARAPRESTQDGSGPHPFRETLLKRASLSAPAGIRGVRLSRLPEFS